MNGIPRIDKVLSFGHTLVAKKKQNHFYLRRNNILLDFRSGDRKTITGRLYTTGHVDLHKSYYGCGV